MISSFNAENFATKKKKSQLVLLVSFFVDNFKTCYQLFYIDFNVFTKYAIGLKYTISNT